MMRASGWVALVGFLAVGFAFTPLGCGSSIPSAVSVPGDTDLARQLRACAAEHEDHLGYAPRSMSFDVKLTDAGYVESIALRDESFRDERLEACMVHALRSLTLDDLPMRLSGSRHREPVAPESRAFVGQTPVDVPLKIALEACLAHPPCAVGLALIVGASLIAVTIYIYVNAPPSLVRPHPPMTMATTMPIATAEPIPVPLPVPVAIPKSEKEACNEMFAVCQGIAGYCTRVDTKGHTICRDCHLDCLNEMALSGKCYRCGFQ